MNAFKEYHNLSVNVRAARRALIAAEQKITAYNDEYRLGGGGNGECACINRFNRVVIDAPDTNQIDDGGFVEECELFDTVSFCKNIKCSMYGDHLEYITALDHYNVARSARWAFVRGLFTRKK